MRNRAKKSSYSEILKSYKERFGDKENMNIDISEIRRRLEPIKNIIQKLGKSDPTRKKEFLSCFTVIKWEIIKQSEKDKHSAGAPRQELKKDPLPQICHTYPTMIKLCTIIPYLNKIQKIYESQDTPPEFS